MLVTTPTLENAERQYLNIIIVLYLGKETYVSLHDIEGLPHISISTVLGHAFVEMRHDGFLQVCVLHVASDAHRQLSHEDDQQEYGELEKEKNKFKNSHATT